MLINISVWFFCSFMVISASIMYDSGKLSDSRLRVVACSLLLFAFIYIVNLAGLRPPESLGDTAKYLWVYKSINSFDAAYATGAALFGNKEILFWPLAYVFKIVGLSGEAWLVMSVIIPAIACVYFYRSLVRIHVVALLFMFLIFSYYVVFICAIRQSYAEALVMLSLALSIKRRLRASLFFALLAVGFHQSAFWGLIIPFLPKIRLGFKNSVYLLLSSIILSAAASGQLLSVFSALGFSSALEKVRFYSSETGTGEFGNLLHHKQFLLLLFISFIYLYRFRNLQDEIYKVVVLIFSMIFFFWSMPVMGGRLLGYLTILFPVLVYRLISGSVAFQYNNTLLSVFFSFLGFTVLMNESAQLVLGLDLR